MPTVLAKMFCSWAGIVIFTKITSYTHKNAHVVPIS